MSSTRPSSGRKQQAGFVSTLDALSEEELESERQFAAESRHRVRSKREDLLYHDESGEDGFDEENVVEQGRSGRSGRRRLGSRMLISRSARASRRQSTVTESTEEDADEYYDDTPLSNAGPRKRKHRSSNSRGRALTSNFIDDGEDFYGSNKAKHQRISERRSNRATRHQGAMKEVDINDIYRSDPDSTLRMPAEVQATGVKEAFKHLPRDDDFRVRHMQECEVCGQGSNFAPLINCQGCVLSYHKSCLGHRTGRKHLVTKVGDEDFVLQCRRCIGFAKKEDPNVPDQGKCTECHEHGNACLPFRSSKTRAQEQRDRNQNGGDDPVYEVDKSRINKSENVLFRCINCWRAFHFEHLPPRNDVMDPVDFNVDVQQRVLEYSQDWICKDCLTAPSKVAALVAWKPVDEKNYEPALAFDMIDEENKTYLVRWEGMSYFQCAWMPGAWVWGTTAHMMRKAFGKRDENRHPKMRTEDAIPEDYLRTDIVLDVEFTSIVDICTKEVDKARISEIDKALIKFKGLGYEDAVWEAPPSPEDGDSWTDFVRAYDDWVLGRYTRVPPQAKLKDSLERARRGNFLEFEKKAQPYYLEGGELMDYQLEGVNWLYNKWFTQKNAILADEMGLGKTVQIIGILATLVQDHGCWPFLVMVPNSTCPNWRREMKHWAPSLRVVTYYGSKESRELAYRYELFPQESKDLRCHIVITTYDAATDDNCRNFLRRVPWQGVIVDEAQRLNNDKNLLYSALDALKAPFRILLTGTPLQNNQRELFNLLQFLDDTCKAEVLEQHFADLKKEKIGELHNFVRPFILRRTKAQVLTLLPPMAQIIVPVSMSIVQKKLYRSILAKNLDLMKAIFSTEDTIGKCERATLSNVLMQLRKCLCHPFVYHRSIEEKNVSIAASHRNLIDASSKLKFLELLLPKLKERGHRVLIFSQFLDMLDIVEDFMDGTGFSYQRLDGSMSSLQKQKRIDEYNAQSSTLFGFLLSTRAGGVGINLATADTVIILDPDFNPHQDLQALSRAHRIGQNKKVLCLQLVTRATAEERIMQMGRRKLALDHVLIDQMDTDDADQSDLVSLLRHGANELFTDETGVDITYDAVSIDHLIDRSAIGRTMTGEGSLAETQWSHARVWTDTSASLTQDGKADDDQTPDPGLWAKILKERELVAAEDAAANIQALGKGKRAKGQVHYATEPALELQETDFETLWGDEVHEADERVENSRQSVQDDDLYVDESSTPPSGDEGTVQSSKRGAALTAHETSNRSGAKLLKLPASTSTKIVKTKQTRTSTPRKPERPSRLPKNTPQKPSAGVTATTMGKKITQDSSPAEGAAKRAVAKENAKHLTTKRSTEPSLSSRGKSSILGNGDVGGRDVPAANEDGGQDDRGHAQNPKALFIDLTGDDE